MAPAAPEETTHFSIVVAIIFPPFKGNFQALPSKVALEASAVFCCRHFFLLHFRRINPWLGEKLFRSPPFKIASVWCYVRMWWRTVLPQADGQIGATVPPAVCFKKWGRSLLEVPRRFKGLLRTHITQKLCLYLGFLACGDETEALWCAATHVTSCVCINRMCQVHVKPWSSLCISVHVYTYIHAHTDGGQSSWTSIQSALKPQVVIPPCRARARQMHVHRKLNEL